ncbi:MAG: hypothetical protein ACRDKK_01945, partial [Gaiellaceae bacterium]
TEEIAAAFDACERTWRDYRKAQERGDVDEATRNAARKSIESLMRLVRAEVRQGVESDDLSSGSQRQRR